MRWPARDFEFRVLGVLPVHSPASWKAFQVKLRQLRSEVRLVEASLEAIALGLGLEDGGRDGNPPTDSKSSRTATASHRILSPSCEVLINIMLTEPCFLAKWRAFALLVRRAHLQNAPCNPCLPFSTRRCKNPAMDKTSMAFSRVCDSRVAMPTRPCDAPNCPHPWNSPALQQTDLSEESGVRDSSGSVKWERLLKF